MQTLLISKRVLGQLPARTKIYENQKQPKDQKATSQPRRPYVVFLVYFPANPSVYVSQSSSDSWTHWSNTNKSGRDVEVTDLWWCKRFHGNGKKTQTRVPTKKDCPEEGCTAWPLLGQAAHVMLQTSRWDSLTKLQRHRKQAPISSAAPRTAAWATWDVVSAHAFSGHVFAYTWFLSWQYYRQLGNDNCLSPTYRMLKILSAETCPVFAEEIQIL